LSRNRVLLMSEMSNWPKSQRGRTEEVLNQIERMERGLAEIERHDFVAGYAFWCFADYATQRKERFVRHPGSWTPGGCRR